MKMHVQISLVIAAFLFLFWGVVLLLGQEAEFGMFSSGAYDSVSVSMLGAAFIGYVFILIIVASNPAPDTVGSIAAAMILMSVITGYQILASHTIPMGMPNIISFLASATIGVILMIGRTQMDAAESGPASGSRAASKATGVARPAGKKTAGKKSKKKAATATKKKPVTRKTRR